MDIQKYRPEKIFCKRRKISGFIVGDEETQIKVVVGKEYFLWIWIAIESINNKLILDIYLSAAERNMFVAEKFLHSLVKERIWKNIKSQQIWWCTWYPSYVCKLLNHKTSFTFIL